MSERFVVHVRVERYRREELGYVGLVAAVGSQDLGGFVFSSWNFCSFDKKGLLSFVYDMCCAEELRLGTLRYAFFMFLSSVSESLPMICIIFSQMIADSAGLRALLTDIHFSRASEDSSEIQSLKRLIAKLPPSRVLNRSEFVEFASRHMSFARPLFTLQFKTRNALFGGRYWQRMESKRKHCESKLYNPLYWAQLQTRCIQMEAPSS